MRKLLKEGATVLLRDNMGKTPLHLAAAVGNGAVLSMLLRHGPDGEGPDRLADLRGFTPIHWACYGGEKHSLLGNEQKAGTTILVRMSPSPPFFFYLGVNHMVKEPRTFELRSKPIEHKHLQ